MGHLKLPNDLGIRIQNMEYHYPTRWRVSSLEYHSISMFQVSNHSSSLACETSVYNHSSIWTGEEARRVLQNNKAHGGGKVLFSKPCRKTEMGGLTSNKS
jgi:hypothetical protein